jgi:chromosome segregation ATPase
MTFQADKDHARWKLEADDLAKERTAHAETRKVLDDATILLGVHRAKCTELERALSTMRKALGERLSELTETQKERDLLAQAFADRYPMAVVMTALGETHKDLTAARAELEKLRSELAEIHATSESETMQALGAAAGAAQAQVMRLQDKLAEYDRRIDGACVVQTNDTDRRSLK